MPNHSLAYGIIKHLFLKPGRGSTMLARQNLALQVGKGIEGDIHAHPISPRQILIVRDEDLLQLSIQPGELSENVVISGFNSTRLAPGAVIESDRGAAIRLTFYCEPCKKIAPLVKSLKQLEQKRGILGVILKESNLTIGDRLTVRERAFPALSEIPYERFIDFISKIPPGKVVTYKQVIVGIGVSQGYLRAIPNYLKKAELAGYPAHRIVDSQGNLTPHLSQQREQLKSENIEVLREIKATDEPEQYFVPLQDYAWEEPMLYL